MFHRNDEQDNTERFAKHLREQYEVYRNLRRDFDLLVSSLGLVKRESTTTYVKKDR